MDDQTDPSSLTARPARPPGPIIVAVGASAGGLEALRELFSAMVPDERLAFVVITHMPNHFSLLPELLQRAGPLPAHEIKAGDIIQGGRIHVMPASRWLTVRRGLLSFDQKPVDRPARLQPIVSTTSQPLAESPPSCGQILVNAEQASLGHPSLWFATSTKAHTACGSRRPQEGPFHDNRTHKPPTAMYSP